jgi:hypothetical protein
VLVDTDGLEDTDVVALPLGETLCDVDTDVDAVIEEASDAVSIVDEDIMGVIEPGGVGDDTLEMLESNDADWALLRDARLDMLRHPLEVSEFVGDVDWLLLSRVLLDSCPVSEGLVDEERE